MAARRFPRRVEYGPCGIDGLRPLLVLAGSERDRPWRCGNSQRTSEPGCPAASRVRAGSRAAATDVTRFSVPNARGTRRAPSSAPADPHAAEEQGRVRWPWSKSREVFQRVQTGPSMAVMFRKRRMTTRGRCGTWRSGRGACPCCRTETDRESGRSPRRRGSAAVAGCARVPAGCNPASRALPWSCSSPGECRAKRPESFPLRPPPSRSASTVNAKVMAQTPASAGPSLTTSGISRHSPMS